MRRALLRFLLLAMAGMATSAAGQTAQGISTRVAVAISAENHAGHPNPGMCISSAGDGHRVCLWNDQPSYGLRHLPNVMAAVEEKGKPMRPSIADYIPDETVLPDSYALLVHPDGSVSREQVGWPAEGDGYSWMGSIGGALYAAIQAPGVYTVKFRVADMEAGPITFEVVPEADDFRAGVNLNFLEALRRARGAAAQVIRADALKRGYEPLFMGGRDDEEETWVTFLKRFNDGHREEPDHAIVAYNKESGALRWVPIE